MKPGNQALLGARMRSFEQKQFNGERCTRRKAMPYHSPRTRDWNENDVIAIALTTVSNGASRARWTHWEVAP